MIWIMHMLVSILKHTSQLNLPNSNWFDYTVGEA
jgi:hypothetical protein